MFNQLLYYILDFILIILKNNKKSSTTFYIKIFYFVQYPRISIKIYTSRTTKNNETIMLFFGLIEIK